MSLVKGFIASKLMDDMLHLKKDVRVCSILNELENQVATMIILIAGKVVEDWLSKTGRLLLHGKVSKDHLKDFIVVLLDLSVLRLYQGLIGIECEFSIWIIDLAVDDTKSIRLLWC